MIRSPFRPPARAPEHRASAAAATPIGSPPSRQSLPKTTAERPINEPTDRSIPPLVITGVSATASRPISTLRRTTSNALATEKKLVPITANTAISSASRPTRIAWAGSGENRDIPATSISVLAAIAVISLPSSSTPIEIVDRWVVPHSCLQFSACALLVVEFATQRYELA